ncbi:MULTISPECIES: ArsR/SmtB family transcription factor [Acinetobacter]|jgi:DNA-binding transcriptional ArsR family regulator|uniref:Winged helix-turn-helix transcriptional regulator n=1 Tax=Acinetobacter pollinis TaxID=2605270 RepID=A0ABU6DUT8_9GAMM|nr:MULTISPECIES: metalloregulator ArsR/SmtB family transcription factor [Acinetobacter]MBF7691784.1 winged helix-turn-helix transcriptional regulator [Acinetobacter pollinis]MBF7692949.1 winged helix-turn-helix transcriptional regulator [Acinetobacter pollinis]MBF7700472.1 winged helix-turn-helix transcriptional regulator [Acinetobacter pollinis]MEB5477422.1 winged helix-turn-helix transcriptional regulator [Acinetobacter pollinis]WEV49949.1 metalloregulator ArsR/SmtB family transcription fact
MEATLDMSMNVIRDQSDDIVVMLKSLANKDRLVILSHLLIEELNVSEIEEKTKILQPTLSQQLMILRKNGVVSTRRAGKQIYYSIKDQRFNTILNRFSQFYQ